MNFRLAVDDFTEQHGCYICACYTHNMPEEMEPGTTEKIVTEDEVLKYVYNNKSEHAIWWIREYKKSTAFQNMLADIINDREQRNETFYPSFDADSIEVNGVPDIFSILECFNPNQTNTFIIRKTV